jgi:hypothetical protein
MRRTWALLAPLAGCAGKTGNAVEAPVQQQVISQTQTEEGLISQRIDFDSDGRPEVVNYLRERSEAAPLLVRKELDLDRDGRVDVMSLYDQSGVLIREELDSDFDGRFDAADYYEGGIRVKSEYDTDFDGRANVSKYYVKDASGAVYLDRKERDTDGDGRIDVWERFNAKGEVVRAARDTDGDGRTDTREE